MVTATLRPIYVREVVLDDLKHNATVHRVVNDAYRSEGGWTTEKDMVKGDRASVEDIENAVRCNGKPNFLMYAFERSDHGEELVVGTIQIQPCNGGTEAEIGLFSVSPAHQSRGIGGKLLSAALQKMEQLGYENAVIQVLENRQDILAWYQKMGFVKTGERMPFVWPEKLKIQGLHFLILKKPMITV
ncbi:acyl-CoA N-acyltransferase [Radiomyces spectabilis]|uniref:acyl-CoA N-acyltransferase n=1 Tax=Radiomyces spectabilis TaxID=64574 RepID=UPI00222105CA|nr:acyl-CoA N-acyltransferase [Radiomyces spectabilis]KAI8379058.1 acyl-CoA N-acyltransferase [Radiomyces spectabilis]